MGYISTSGIQSGSLIEASQVLNIINALNGVTGSDIKVGASFTISSSGDFIMEPGSIGLNNSAPTTLLYDTGSGLVYYATSTPGASGSSGSSGTSGGAGASGSSGTSGTSGANGSSGTSGAAGTSGSSGTSGGSGSSGTSGTSGSNGSSGTSGTSGSNGSSGTSGANGTAGTSGSSGTSGTTPTYSTTSTMVINLSLLVVGNTFTVTSLATTNILSWETSSQSLTRFLMRLVCAG